MIEKKISTTFSQDLRSGEVHAHATLEPRG